MRLPAPARTPFRSILGAGVLAAACAASLLAPAVVSAQETTLSAVVFVPRQSTFGEMFTRFVEHVNREGKGLVQIRLAGGPDAMPAFEQANAVSKGVVDMAALGPSFYAGVVPEGDAQSLASYTTPELKKNGGWAALNGILNRKLNAQLLTAYGDGLEYHLWTTRAPEGGKLAGMRLRTTPNYTAFFNALGVVPVQLAPGEVMTGLERGVVQGYGWPAIGVFDLGWGPYTKFRVDPGFYNVLVNVIVNLDKWKGLREDQRAFLVRMADWLEAENVKWVAQKKAEEAKRAADAGIRAVDLGAAHRKLAYDSYWAELAKRAPESIATLRPLLEKK